MLIAELFCLAESNSVDDGSMVEGIRENRVLRTQKLLKQSGIGVETTKSAGMVNNLNVFSVTNNGGLQAQVDLNNTSCFSERSLVNPPSNAMSFHYSEREKREKTAA